MPTSTAMSTRLPSSPGPATRAVRATAMNPSGHTGSTTPASRRMRLAIHVTSITAAMTIALSSIMSPYPIRQDSHGRRA